MIIKKKKKRKKTRKVLLFCNKRKQGKNAQMEQSLKESEPFLPCGWNVFARAAVQMEALPKPLVWRGVWRWGGVVGGGKGSIHTYIQ